MVIIGYYYSYKTKVRRICNIYYQIQIFQINIGIMDRENKGNKGQITVTVDAPELKTEMGGASKHHTYRISGSDQLSEFDILRRYSDFVILKQHMSARWPGVYIPALPQKKFLGNNEAAFLDVRRRGLEEFLKHIAEQGYLWYGDEFQLFIKSKSIQVDKFLGNLGKTNNRQIAVKFRTKFPSLLEGVQQQKPSQQNSLKIGQFRNYLKNAQIILEKVSKVADLMTESRKRFNERYEGLLTNILNNYEEKCVSEYAEDKHTLLFMNAAVNGVAQCEANYFKAVTHNPMSIINELIKQQIREILNFQQILKNKEQFEASKLKALSRLKDLQIQQTKINAGKQSIMSKIKSTSKEQQLIQVKKQLQKARDDLKDAEEICKVIDKILAQDQIAKFKQSRQKNYYHAVSQMAKAEKQCCAMQQELWLKIAGGQGGFMMEEKIQNKTGSSQEQFRATDKQELASEKVEVKITQNQEPEHKQQLKVEVETHQESANFGQRKQSLEGSSSQNQQKEHTDPHKEQIQ